MKTLDGASGDPLRSFVAHDPAAVRSPYADALKSLELGFAANQSMESGQVVYLK